MRALVVYESMFGNTRKIAEAIAAGLASDAASGIEVSVVEVGVAPAALDPQLDLLVAGGPTHAFGLSRPRTRRSAAQQASRGVVSTGIGLREWLAALPPAAGVTVAAFDTRSAKPRWMPGSAARAAARQLRGLGFRLVGRPARFCVSGITGPLVPGEIERAQHWGETLGAAVSARQPA